MSEPQKKRFQLPSIVWVLLIVLGLIAFVAALIGGFFAISTLEGVASIVMLAAGWLTLRAVQMGTGKKSRSSSLGQGMGVAFFALMGLAIDQPGNVLYNQPLQWLFCPPETVLSRGVDINHPRAGVTQISQEFACLNRSGQTVRQISMFELMGVRFGEYVLIAYALIGASALYTRWRSRSPAG